MKGVYAVCGALLAALAIGVGVGISIDVQASLDWAAIATFLVVIVALLPILTEATRRRKRRDYMHHLLISKLSIISHALDARRSNQPLAGKTLKEPELRAFDELLELSHQLDLLSPSDYQAILEAISMVRVFTLAGSRAVADTSTVEVVWAVVIRALRCLGVEELEGKVYATVGDRR